MIYADETRRTKPQAFRRKAILVKQKKKNESGLDRIWLIES